MAPNDTRSMRYVSMVIVRMWGIPLFMMWKGGALGMWEGEGVHSTGACGARLSLYARALGARRMMFPVLLGAA